MGVSGLSLALWSTLFSFERTRDFDDSSGDVDPVALWDIRCNLAIISILAERRASQPETSFPMRTTVNISEDAKTIARLLGHPEENIGHVVETYADWEIETMANDPDHLIRELGDLIWEDSGPASNGTCWVWRGDSPGCRMRERMEHRSRKMGG